MPEVKPAAVAAEPPEAKKPGPEKSTGDKDRAKPKSRKPQGRPPSLEKRLQELFVMVAMVVGPLNERDGAIILSSSESLAKSWTALANENAAVKRVLERLVETSAWSQVVFSTGGVALAIAVNHGVELGPFGSMLADTGDGEPEGPPPPPPGASGVAMPSSPPPPPGI